jgi:hypothetical protein
MLNRIVVAVVCCIGIFSSSAILEGQQQTQQAGTVMSDSEKAFAAIPPDVHAEFNLAHRAGDRDAMIKIAKKCGSGLKVASELCSDGTACKPGSVILEFRIVTLEGGYPFESGNRPKR